MGDKNNTAANASKEAKAREKQSRRQLKSGRGSDPNRRTATKA